MGKHSEWRKLVKKLRRKRIRREKALLRDSLIAEEDELKLQSPSYRKALEDQESAEKFQEEEEKRISEENNREWLKREEEAQLRWVELQKKLESAREERAKQNAKIKAEWEAEQKRLKELKEIKEKEEEDRKVRQEELKQKIEEYITHGGDIPEQLLVSLETNPRKEICPFFKKTGACRFGDTCSRNHARPGVSKIILLTNFYSHYYLEQSGDSEYGNDSSLEFENHEMVNHFKEFFYDVLPEMEKCGRVKQFKVCCNREAHLRGNVYVEYSDCREAMKAYKLFQGRWYGGKQLNVEFSFIESWKSAICGLFFKQRCPKGSSCNFLHVFRNPCNLFQNADKDLHRTPPPNIEINNGEESRNWRWSESPEPFEHKENGNRNDNDAYQRKFVRDRGKGSESGSERRTSRKRRRRSRSRSSSRRKRRSRSKSRSYRSSWRSRRSERSSTSD